MHTLPITAPGDDEALSVELQSSALSDVGRERERNEDQYLIATLQRTMSVVDTSVQIDAWHWLPRGEQGLLLLVADGMGGAGGGDVASSVAVRAISDYLVNIVPSTIPPASSAAPFRDSTIPGVRRGLRSALVQGDLEVRAAAHTPGASETMGTTLTMAYVLWPRLYVAHVGDSRCYRLRQGKLEQLTTDHTLAKRLEQRTDVVIDDTSPWHHVLWNALGGGDAPAAQPEVHRSELEASDLLLLCSDGLTKHVTDDEIALALESSDSPREACKRLVAMANTDGGTDNITVVVTRCHRDFTDSEVAPTVPRPAPRSED